MLNRYFQTKPNDNKAYIMHQTLTTPFLAYRKLVPVEKMYLLTRLPKQG